MDWKWRSIAELIGLTAVVVSLLLVAYELRQAQLSLSAAAHSDRADRLLDIYEYMATSGFAAAAAKARSGHALSATERQVLRSMSQMVLRHFEDLHYQYAIGVIDEETWLANTEGMKTAFLNPAFEAVWEESRSQHESRFAEFVDGLRAQSPDY